MTYNLAVLISNPSVILDTFINIPKEGIVPIKPSGMIIVAVVVVVAIIVVVVVELLFL